LKILILGAGGFIGSHLVEHLVARGNYEVVALDVSSEKLADIDATRFEFHQHDIRRDGGLLDRLVRAADVVVDLIAYANPSLYVSAPLEVFELNFLRNLEIAKSCIRHGKRLIQYSSAEVYGKAGDGTMCQENATDSIFGPVDKSRWIYATGKLLLERVLHAYGQAGQLEYTIVRPFNFLGSRLDYLVPPETVGGPRVFPHFMSALLTGGPIRLVNGGHVHRAFLHVEDANLAFQTLLDHRDEARNDVFNVGNPHNNITIRELALLMCQVYGEITGREPTSPIEEMDGALFYGAGYEDGDRLPPDIAKIGRLGWRPRYDLRTALIDAMLSYLPSQLPRTRKPQTVGATAGAASAGRMGAPMRVAVRQRART
jgi:UDP-apiose/xylose synthase